ncbi:hypothetical protein MUY27_20105 [Mucilaginibacter sp. RS28]|uniref:Uncharacterized protein n=1 Tax=Mucilaginibacter straminoryzae TaxID=2932774 RepID=A0A9X1X7M3_9SPHI|nr:hypothetical protein [Mucilaginibacter straminoryzae]MCJ8212031.1 hypothetical protein [Mucilaginibacter straminoryzae]
MAELRKTLWGKTAASTILEVVIAMLIIVVVIGLAFMIVTNVSRLSLSGRRVKAAAILEDAMTKNADRHPKDSTWNADEWHIKQQVKKEQEAYGTSTLVLTLYDTDDQPIDSLKRVLKR